MRRTLRASAAWPRRSSLVGLAGPELLHRTQEFEDGITVAIQSIFPTCVNQQIYNTLAIRQLTPQGPHKCELHWTVFGYKDDTPELRQMRLMQANLIGPAGYVSIDDGVIGEYVQRGVGGTGVDANAVMEMGGSAVVSARGSRATEATRSPVSGRPRARTKRPICFKSWCAPASARTTWITARGCATPRRWRR